MYVIIRILLGALAGWLTGKLADDEGYSRALISGHRQLLDIIYGIIGATIGDYLFFWAVIGKGSAFSSNATAVLGAITLVGLARLIAGMRRAGNP